MSEFVQFALAVSSAFPALYLAGAALFFFKFRGTRAGIIGTLGFLLWLVVPGVRMLVAVLELDYGPYRQPLHAIGLLAFLLVLYALATIPLGASGSQPASAAERGERPRSVTVISILLMVLAGLGVVTLTVTAYLIEFDSRFMPPLLAMMAAAVLQAVLGGAMLKGQNWARWTYLILAPASLAVALVGGSFRAGGVIQAVFWIVAAYFLTRPAAAAYFAPKVSGTAPQPESRGEPVRDPGAENTEPMDVAMDALATVVGNQVQGTPVYEVLLDADGGVDGLWIKNRELLENPMFLRTCLVAEKLPKDVVLDAYLRISDRNYRVVDNPDRDRSGVFVMFANAKAPFESHSTLEEFHWKAGDENPASTDIESQPTEQTIRFACPTCSAPVSCRAERMHGLIGTMIECGSCGNICHVPASCLDLETPDREPVRACVFVPIAEFSAWYYAHPQCQNADPTHEALYGIWAFCASCKREYKPSVLFPFSMSESAGGILFNANSTDSAQDFEALRNGACPDCGHDNLLVLRLPIPERVQVEIDAHLSDA